MVPLSKPLSSSPPPALRNCNLTNQSCFSKTTTAAINLCGLFGFLFLLAAVSTTLPTVGGAAVPIVRAGIQQQQQQQRQRQSRFRIRVRSNSSDNDDRNAEEDHLVRRGFGSRFPFFSARQRGWFRKFVSEKSNPHQQHQQPRHQQHGLPPAGFVLAGSIGPKGNGGGGIPRGAIGAVGGHPKWCVCGGVVLCAGQKALRSEAVKRAARFWWNIGPLVVHYRFTRWWLRKSGAPLEKRDGVYQWLHEKYAPVARGVALELKGLYIKLAQVVSSRPDFVPLPYIALFVDAQDSLPQWPIEEVTELVGKALESISSSSSSSPSLGFDEVFEDIDAIALGSASIGQCHRASIKRKYAHELLLDSNSNENENENDETALPVSVAIKVMHPGAEERFRNDFCVFRWLCKVALTGWEPILDELYRQIMSEFDYRREANSLDVVRSNMQNSPFRRSVRVPKPLLGLCSKELLVMELLDGTKLSDSLEKELEDILGTGRAKKLLDRKRLELVLGEDKLNALESVGANDSKISSEKSLLAECGWTTKLKLLGLYRRAQSAIDMLVDVEGYQMLKDGVFQGDPHPGNILDLRKPKSGGKIANFCRMGPSSSLLGLIDYGQTKHFTDEERLGIARVILALGEDHGDGKSSSQTKTERVANAMRDVGFATKFDDPEILEKYAGLFFDSDDDGKRLYNCPTPQTYYKILTKLDPLVSVPDAAIFAARCGFLLRGMGSILGKQIRTSKRWSIYAKQALEEAETTTTTIG